MQIHQWTNNSKRFYQTYYVLLYIKCVQNVIQDGDSLPLISAKKNARQLLYSNYKSEQDVVNNKWNNKEIVMNIKN